ncbi:hypothetical protein AKO1_010928 [Acrasis kona]|uniref:Lipoprotein n=1 Tax=Acrasis kona TaxID=1008807 RepID=A0AAW2YS60_9EUKA
MGRKTKIIVAGAALGTAIYLYKNNSSEPIKTTVAPKKSSEDWPEDSMTGSVNKKASKAMTAPTSSNGPTKYESLKGKSIDEANALLGRPTETRTSADTYPTIGSDEEQFLLENRSPDVHYYHWNVGDNGFVRVYVKDSKIIQVFHKTAPISKL